MRLAYITTITVLMTACSEPVVDLERSKRYGNTTLTVYRRRADPGLNEAGVVA